MMAVMLRGERLVPVHVWIQDPRIHTATLQSRIDLQRIRDPGGVFVVVWQMCQLAHLCLGRYARVRSWYSYDLLWPRNTASETMRGNERWKNHAKYVAVLCFVQ